VEFGLFAQLFVPKYERDVDPLAEHNFVADRRVALGAMVVSQGAIDPAHRTTPCVDGAVATSAAA